MSGKGKIKGPQGLFEVTALKPFGAVVDLDLRAPLNAAEQEELRALRLQHQFLLFRGQRLSMEEQERAMLYFGPIVTDPTDRLEYVSRDHPKGQLGEGRLTFHIDLLFTTDPLQGLALHALEVDEGMTSTDFASCRDAYRKLPDALKERLFGLQAVHCLAPDPEGCARDQNPPGFFPRALHQLVTRHPVSGEKLLWASEQQTECISGLARAESDALLDELYSYLYAPENCYSHFWRTGDIVIWDNLALQHGRPKVPDCRRTLQRATGGERGMFEIVPHLRGARLWAD